MALGGVFTRVRYSFTPPTASTVSGAGSAPTFTAHQVLRTNPHFHHLPPSRFTVVNPGDFVNYNCRVLRAVAFTEDVSPRRRMCGPLCTVNSLRQKLSWGSGPHVGGGTWYVIFHFKEYPSDALLSVRKSFYSAAAGPPEHTWCIRVSVCGGEGRQPRASGARVTP